MKLATSYKQIVLDLIKPADDEFEFFFYQRILLRAFMRFKENYITAGRATAKSFLAVIAQFLQCVFIPGRKVCIIMPAKVQAATMAKRKILEIYDHWPVLKREVFGWQLSDTPGNFGKDYIELKFLNGSQLSIVGGDTARGDRRSGAIFDELRKLKNKIIY